MRVCVDVIHLSKTICKWRGIKQPFEAVCMLVRTEVVAAATASSLTPEQHFASYLQVAAQYTLQAFFGRHLLAAQCTGHRP